MKSTKIPFVSLIIPTYNGGKKLEITLGACLKIKAIPLEILVIDDGSTDGTPDRIERTFPTVKLIRLPANSGSGSHGRNVGLGLARGAYVKFLDHDDLIQPRGFRAECKEALNSDADIVISCWGVVPINEAGLFDQSKRRIFAPPDPTRLVEAILLGESTPYTAAALYKRSFVSAEKWDDKQTMIDDFDWFCRMAIKKCKITQVSSISYYWCLHSASFQARSHQHKTIYRELMLARFRVYEKLEKQLREENQLNPLRERLLAKRYYHVLRCLARYDREGCKQLLQTIYQLDPYFVVDATCESDSWALWLIRRIGLANFLAAYGRLRRWADSFPARRDRRQGPRPSGARSA